MSGELAVRLSDEERWEATRVLDAAVADGRITWDEHAERSAMVLAARTRGDLGLQLADLGPTRPVEISQPVVATLSKIVRTPEATREVYAKANFGAVILDLGGLRPGEQIHITADAFCGKIAVYVPDDAVVIDDGTAALGNRKIFGSALGQGGPVVRISGKVTMGNLKVFRDEIRHW
jgi:DUF1707 SHOCT-like domain